MSLADSVLNQLRSYFAGQPDVVAAILFGSLARDDARPDSDVDIAVLLTHEAANRGIDRSRLIADLMGLLRRNDVDVVVLNGASPLFQHRVVRDGHVIFARDHTALAEFVIRAIQRYQDTRALRELQRRRLEERLAASAPSRGDEP